jgi:hypothetical protein
MSGLTLESVEQAFAQWREQRSSRSESIPKKLWEMVLKIYPKYKRTVICRRLRLSGSQLKQQLDSSSSSGAGFVLASANPIKEKLTPNLQLTIQGKERALMLSVDKHTFDKILPSIGMLL